MKIIIKPVWGILICGVMISGLSACSSSPSPWSQGDDSPWKSKRDAELEGLPSDEFINATPMEGDPVPLEDPEPIVESESEAWPYQPPPEPVEEPPPPEPVMASSGYAVQLFAGRVMNNVTRYQETHGLGGTTKIVKTDRDGDIIYVLVHIEPDKAGAQQYAAEIDGKTGSTSWIRSVKGLQAITAQ